MDEGQESAEVKSDMILRWCRCSYLMNRMQYSVEELQKQSPPSVYSQRYPSPLLTLAGARKSLNGFLVL